MPDPKLLAAAEEIKAIIAKYDICAGVVLASETHMEYVNVFECSWTCLKVEDTPAGQAVRFRAKRAEFASDEEFKRMQTNTVGVVCGFADVHRTMFEMWSGLAVMVGKKIKFEHMSKHEPGATLKLEEPGESGFASDLPE